MTLTAKSPLDGVRIELGEVTIAEVTGRAIVSIATPHGGENALSEALAAAYKIEYPGAGKSAVSDIGRTRFLGLQQDQIFALFEGSSASPVGAIAEKLGDAAYLTDQSDSWVMISVSGPKCRTALERICPIDLHPDAFPEGAVARTIMEHLGSIILREGPEHYLLMSARSSAASFLHAIETSARNVI
jgi:sarcosine oxidase subunit gamma